MHQPVHDAPCGIASNIVPGNWQSCTFALLLVVCFIDGADLQLTPASFRALEADLGFTPADLGKLAMMQALFLSALAPFWGSAADTGLLQKKSLLATACAGWGVFTIAISTASSLYSMLLLRAFIGTCLAALLPLSQAIIATQVGHEERGRLFGWVAFSQMMGQVTTSLFATSISNMRFSIFGSETAGWRIAFFSVGASSIIFAAVLALLMEEPASRLGSVSQRPASVQGMFHDVFLRIGIYFQISTFRVIVLQGLFGMIPWRSLDFLAMFFQYIGFEDDVSALLVTFLMLGLGIGAFFGGFIGDSMAKWSRHHGRLITAQVSIALGIACVIPMFCVISPVKTNFLTYAGLIWFLGLSASWTLAGVKRPILTEVVEAEDWASFLALDTAIEGSFSAVCGAPVVGILAEHAFGYVPVSGQVRDMIPQLRQKNQEALGKAMTLMTIIPWVVCLVIWSYLHILYPRDLEKIEREREAAGDLGGYGETAPLIKIDDGCMEEVSAAS